MFAFWVLPVQITRGSGAIIAAKENVQPERIQRTAEQRNALQALKQAVTKGATSQYETLLNRATRAGITDEEIDLLVHEALREMFANAERPVTGRDLPHLVLAGTPDA